MRTPIPGRRHAAAGIFADIDGKACNMLAEIESCARMLTGAIFVLVGIYFSLKYVLGTF